ncbi:MAG: hemerythrin domain-containing protein [Rhodocyclaceae bacterium]|nr:hemerythrin domain-containing protein [Rhodocyclaceae bacterium]
MNTNSAAASVVSTGHPEIDSQHGRLSDLTGRLGSICVLGEARPGHCLRCSAETRSSCTNRLADLIGELLGFMVTHFAYEEGLMRQLPPTEAGRMHMEAHKLAHAEISQRLSELTLKLDEESPLECSDWLQKIIGSWMGDHAEHHDVGLASELAKAYETEICYDVELARLLKQ